MTLLVLMLQLVIALGTLRVAAAVAVPFTPTLFFNFSLSPLSPSLTFVPDMQTNRVGKDQFPPPWNTTFSDALWSSYVSGQVGVGKPRTFIHGPARLYGPLRIDYTGTGLYIEGEYDLSNRTDESSDWNRTGPPQPNDPLRSINFASGQSTTSYFGSRNRSTFKVLAQDTDSFSESAKPNFISAQGSIKISEEGESSIYFALDTFVVETGMRTNATTLGDVSTRVEYAVVDGGPEPGLNRNLLWQKGPEAPSHWQVSTELNGIAQSSTPYSGQRTAVTTTLTDEFGMAIPRGTAFIVVNGTTGPTKGWARISLKHEGLGTTVREPVLTNPWISVETIFWAPLDPSLQHNLTIVPITGPANVTKGRYSNGIGLHSVTLYAAGDVPDERPTDPNAAGAQGGKRKSNTGAIVGGVVGGIVVLAVVAALVWFVRRKKQSESKSKFQIEDEPPEYKNVDDGGYTNAALSTSAPSTVPLLAATDSAGSPTPLPPTTPVTHAVSGQNAPFQQAVMHALDSEDAPFQPQSMHALDSEDAPFQPQAMHALDSDDVPASHALDSDVLPAHGRPLPAIPGSSSGGGGPSGGVSMPQYKLDALLGIRPGDRSGKAASSMVRVPQEKLDLLANIRAPEPGPADRVVSMPQHELEALLGMTPSANEGDTVLSLPQYKIDALLSTLPAERPPPSYYG